MKSVLITSSILILVIAALRPILRGRSRPLVQYALWLIVAVRLLVPWEAAPSAYSALALLERAEEPAHLAETIGQTTVPIPGMSYEDAYDQALREYHQNQPIQTSFTDLDEVERRAREIQTKAPTLAELAARYARPVWLGGGLLMGLWFLLVNLRLRRRLRSALPVEADCPLPVRVSPELPSPCLCGTIRPVICVTPGALADSDRIRHVLAHEMTHYRHKDHWWALVRCLCLCLYWFDPLVWWAAAMSRQDCELACDAGAIRRLGEAERLPYGRTLVAMIAAGRNPLLQTATTMTGCKRRVKERVELIARRPKTAVALVLAAAMLLGLTACFTFTGAPEETPSPSQTPGKTLSQSLTEETLQDRLLDIPEELRNTVEARPDNGALAGYYFKHPGEEMNKDLYLLFVSQITEEEFRQRYFSGGYSPVGGGSHCFAKGGGLYYLTQWNTSIEYEPEDQEQFNSASLAIREYVQQTVLGTDGVEPFDLDVSLEPLQPIWMAANFLYTAPSVDLWLSIGTTGYPTYSTVPSQDSDGYYLNAFTVYFDFEPFDWGTTEDPRFPATPHANGSLSIMSPDYDTYIHVWEDSDLVAVHDGKNGTNWYHTRYAYPGIGRPPCTPYEYLRQWYDRLELTCLRSTTVPGRGQSHEEIVREWTGAWEGTMTKTVPDSAYACTYIRIENIRVDQPEFPSREALEEFVQSRNTSFTADDFGKTWFGFSYDTVFVPANQSTASPFWAGNTREYEGGDAPEGALIYSHVGYIWLTDEGWTCYGTGTGW